MIHNDLFAPHQFGILFDTQGRLVNVCTNATTLLSFSFDDLLGHQVSEFADVDPPSTTWVDVFAHVHDGSDLYNVVWRTGTRQTFATTGRFLLLPMGMSDYLFGVFGAEPSPAHISPTTIFNT